jgi:hypothetical protein
MSSGSLESIENGIGRLTSQEKLELIERLARSLRETPSPRTAEQQRAAFNQLRKEMATIPVSNPADAWSARDHDQLLYGESH